MSANPEPVLIAEDSPTQALRLRNTLEKNGFSVTAARDGCEALDALAVHRPALVISDIQMPRMDGYELCRRLKNDPALRDIPLVLLTSLSSPEDIIRGLECGADNFVVKPYDEDFLLARIRTVLANRGLGAASDSAAIPIHFAGESYEIAADRRQILNLLLSTYETAVKTNRDLVAAHEELKAAQAQLIEAEKLQSVGRLAAGVAHEVRNPLAILEMGISFLADESPSEQGRMILDEMKEAVARASSVISGLMDLSSAREMGMCAANLNASIDEALAALKDQLVQARIIVNKELAEDLSLCRVDSSKIVQMLINVITNACQAMTGAGTLTVRSSVRQLENGDVPYDAGDRSGVRFRAGDQVVVIEVDDSGPGIAPENLTKLFEPFFTTKPTGKGMGLGLTVAGKIVELHGGRIKIENRDSGGARVTIMLTCSPERL